MPDWPQGRWWLWGRLDTPPTKKNTNNFTRIPQFAPEAVFTSNRSFEVLTEQAAEDAIKKVLTAHANEPLTPGATVRFDGSSGTGYINKETLTATDDGCMINGTFADSDGNAGSIHFLYQSPHFYISSK